VETTDNFRKHTAKNPLQRFLINKFFDMLLIEAKKANPQSVLDVGCGEGFTLERLRQNKIGHELVGVDFLERAIKIGKKLHPQLSLLPGTIYHIPFKDNSFDLVICTEVLEHLEYPEKALAELQRVTKGTCIISVPHEPWFRIANLLRGKNISRWGNDIEHIQHWSKRGINALVGKYFSVTEIKNPFPWSMVIAKKV
jgi:ubiquinone/menaquinone biosynthesis C-methylase UbiE